MGKKTKSKIKKEFKKFWIAAFCAMASLMFGAIFQLNSQIHQSSQLDGLEKKIAATVLENDALAARLSQSNSLENFNQYQIAQSGNYELVDVGQVRYVHAPKGEFARK